MYEHCIKNEINPANVELKFFTCRTFCSRGDFAAVTNQPRQQIRDNQEQMELPPNKKAKISGGEHTDDVKPAVNFEPVDKLGLFEYLKQQSESCEIPNKGGKFTKKRRYKSKKKTLKRVSK